MLASSFFFFYIRKTNYITTKATSIDSHNRLNGLLFITESVQKNVLYNCFVILLHNSWKIYFYKHKIIIITQINPKVIIWVDKRKPVLFNAYTISERLTLLWQVHSWWGRFWLQECEGIFLIHCWLPDDMYVSNELNHITQ